MITDEIIKELALLISFADFLEAITDEFGSNKENLNLIKQDINNGIGYSKAQYWHMQLSVTDKEIQEGVTGRKGIWQRNWCVSYENKKLEICCNTFSYPIETPDGDIHFFMAIDFQESKFYSKNQSLVEFLDNARKYSKYFTKYINYVEVDTDYDK